MCQLLNSYYPPHFWRFSSFRLFGTLALAPDKGILEAYKKGQIFWMGKKRTMFQIETLGEIAAAEPADGWCSTEYVQVSSDSIKAFDAYLVLGASQRYLVVSGEGDFEHLRFSSQDFGCVPNFVIRGFLDALR